MQTLQHIKSLSIKIKILYVQPITSRSVAVFLLLLNCYCAEAKLALERNEIHPGSLKRYVSHYKLTNASFKLTYKALLQLG